MDEVLARCGLFQGIAEADAEELAKQLEFIEVSKGHAILTQGEFGDSLFIVLRGTVKVGRRTPDGRENRLAVGGPSDIWGELSSVDPGPRTANALPRTDRRQSR